MRSAAVVRNVTKHHVLQLYCMKWFDIKCCSCGAWRDVKSWATAVTRNVLWQHFLRLCVWVTWHHVIPLWKLVWCDVTLRLMVNMLSKAVVRDIKPNLGSHILRNFINGAFIEGDFWSPAHIRSRFTPNQRSNEWLWHDTQHKTWHNRWHNYFKLSIPLQLICMISRHNLNRSQHRAHLRLLTPIKTRKWTSFLHSNEKMVQLCCTISFRTCTTRNATFSARKMYVFRPRIS